VGQKIHPKGFRLIAAQKYLSNWYSNKNDYAKIIQEDFIIRQEIETCFEKLLILSTIEINRTENLIKSNSSIININISCLFPRKKEILKKTNKYFTNFITDLDLKTFNTLIINKKFFKKYSLLIIRKMIKKLTNLLEKKLNKKIFIFLNFIENPFTDVNLIAKYICQQLENRIPFRRIIKQTITKVQRASMNGIKIQISGRLNGAEIARSEWKKEGKIPLHTLKAPIDYIKQSAKTIYGIIGVKVWLFKNELK
jgi:small subunit ribosomal protein S3